MRGYESFEKKDPFWNEDCDLNILEKDRNYIHANFKEGELEWDVSFIYGAPKEEERHEVWVNLLNYHQSQRRL